MVVEAAVAVGGVVLALVVVQRQQRVQETPTRLPPVLQREMRRRQKRRTLFEGGGLMSDKFWHSILLYSAIQRARGRTKGPIKPLLTSRSWAFLNRRGPCSDFDKTGDLGK